MLESTLTLLKLFVAVAGVVYVVQAWRKAQARHPVFSYEQHSISNQANWRWRKPGAELALQVEDEEQKSCLRLPAQLLFFEKIFVCFGPVTMVAAIAIIIASFYNLGFAVDGRIIFCALIFYFGTFLLNIGARVSELILYPDHLVVVESYAFVLKHTHIFPHQAGLKFRGKSQSMFEMTYDHEEPDFKLFIERPGFLFFTKRKRFILHANQSQGTWLVAGLHYWHENALSAQARKP